MKKYPIIFIAIFAVLILPKISRAATGIPLFNYNPISDYSTSTSPDLGSLSGHGNTMHLYQNLGATANQTVSVAQVVYLSFIAPSSTDMCVLVNLARSSSSDYSTPWDQADTFGEFSNLVYGARATSTDPGGGLALWHCAYANFTVTAGQWLGMANFGGYSGVWLSAVNNIGSISFNHINNTAPANVWWSTSGVDTYYSVCIVAFCDDNPPTTPTPTATFLYPKNGTTTPRFNRFALDFSNLIATHTYYGNVTYFVPQVTPQQSNLLGAMDSSNPNVTIVSDSELVATIPFTINTTIQTLTGATFYAEGDLIDSTECANSITSPTCVTASTTITFTLLPTCSVYGCLGSATTTAYVVYGAVSGTTAGISLHQVSALNGTNGNFDLGVISSTALFSSSVCPAPGGFTDWGGGLNYALCSTINFLFIPSSIITDQVTNQQLLIQGDFPFNMVYGVLNSIQTASNNAGNSTSTALTLNIWGMSLPVLNSSTLSGFIGQSNKNLIFQTEDTIAWVSVASTILKVIF